MKLVEVENIVKFYDADKKCLKSYQTFRWKWKFPQVSSKN